MATMANGRVSPESSASMINDQEDVLIISNGIHFQRHTLWDKVEVFKSIEHI